MVMLGFLVESTYFGERTKSDHFPQVAARKFEFGFLNGFVDNNIGVKVLGFFPSSTYPRNRFILYGYRTWLYRSVVCTTLPFINLPGLKLLTRLASSFIGLVSCIFRGVRSQAICVYSAHSPFLLSARISKMLFGIPYYVVIPDLPELMDVGVQRGLFRKALKSIDKYLIRYLVSKSNGICTVTEFISRDISAWRMLPAVTVEGIAPEVPAGGNVDSIPRGGKPYFLYSGGLNEAYGVKTLVSAFLASNLDAELWLCGSGPLSGFIDECSAKDRRIRNLGFLNQDELLRAQRGAAALLITRAPDEHYVRYSFPSKLLEYMATGVPVLTTRLPGIPVEYFDYVDVIDGVSEFEIVDALRKHLNLDTKSREEKGKKALDFVREYKAAKVAVLPLLKIMGVSYDEI
uniref:Glycosyltransferase n=1 Tax=Aromatoleum toluolicum TaxID=90060 RepID=A0ABX1NEK1_9RHOO|nr:glycosyltransferase [Aromatoleum toluolicum]